MPTRCELCTQTARTAATAGIALAAVMLGSLTFAAPEVVPNADAAGRLAEFKVPAKNFVRNGDFADGTAGWTFFHAPSGGETAGIAAEGEDGGPCLKISGAFNDSIYFQQAFMPNATTLAAGETYTLSASFRAESIAGIDPTKLIHFTDYGWHQSAQLGPSSATTNGWERRSITFKAPVTRFPPDSYKYMLVLYWPKGTSGKVWVDKVQIEVGDKVTDFAARHNDTGKLLADRLGILCRDAAKTRKNIAENFAESATVAALRDRLAGYLTSLEQMATQLCGYENMDGAAIKGLAAQVDALQSGLGALTCLVWFKNPYVASDDRDFPAQPEQALPSRWLVCYVNEVRHLGVMFTNLSGHSIDYRIAPQRFRRQQDGRELDGNGFITVLEAPLIRGTLHPDRLFTDPLPRCGQANGLCVPGGETRQIVLCLDTRSVEPGSYSGTVFLDALNNREALARKLELEMEVLPVRLPDRVEADVCPLGAVNLRPEEARRLGHNFMLLDGGALPIYLDAAGNSTKPIDFAAFDRHIRKCRAVVPGCKFVLLFSLGPAFIRNTERLYGYKWPEERLKKGWQNWVKEIYAQAEASGLRSNEMYLQVVDEPQGAEIAAMAELSRLAKEAVPGLKTLTYGGDPRRHAALFKYLDLPCPASKEVRDAEYLSALKALGLRPGTYDCHEFNEIMCPLTYRRLMPWKVWKYDLSGWHYWYRDDRHPNWGAVKYMSVVYPLAEGELGRALTPDIDYVISRHWLAMEAGCQDYKALVLLKKSLERARTRGATVNAERLAAAEAFLSSAPDRALALDSPDKFPNEMAPGADPDVLDALREDAARLTAALTQGDEVTVTAGPLLGSAGDLLLTLSRPCSLRVEYVVDGALPWRIVEVPEEADEFKLMLDRHGGRTINKCRVHLFADNGTVAKASPLIAGVATVDSTNSGYETTCLTDGIQYPGAQYWPGKTWISGGENAEHWVRLDWGKPQDISAVVVCWMTRGGMPEAFKVQYLAGETWTDLFGWRPATAALEEVEFDPVTTAAVRVVQKAGGGGQLSQTLIGLSEIEVY